MVRCLQVLIHFGEELVIEKVLCLYRTCVDDLCLSLILVKVVVVVLGAAGLVTVPVPVTGQVKTIQLV